MVYLSERCSHYSCFLGAGSEVKVGITPQFWAFKRMYSWRLEQTLASIFHAGSLMRNLKQWARGVTRPEEGLVDAQTSQHWLEGAFHNPTMILSPDIRREWLRPPTSVPKAHWDMQEFTESKISVYRAKCLFPFDNVFQAQRDNSKSWALAFASNRPKSHPQHDMAACILTKGP